MTVFVVFVGDGRGLFTAVAVRMGRAAWLEVPRARFGTGHDFGNHSWAAATKQWLAMRELSAMVGPHSPKTYT